MSLNWNFQRGVGLNQKKPPWGEYGYFLEQHISLKNFSVLYAVIRKTTPLYCRKGVGVLLCTSYVGLCCCEGYNIQAV